MKIPWQSLSEVALTSLIQEFVSREGTEYGAADTSLEEKTSQVMLQIRAGVAEIVFDPEAQTTSIAAAEAVSRHNLPR